MDGLGLGLIRKIRDGRDSWRVRLEDQRKQDGAPDSPNERENEEEKVGRKRKMFGKIFNGRKPEQ